MDHEGAPVRAQNEALNVEFWYRVDHHNGESAAFVGDEPAVLPFAPGDAGKGAVDAV